MKRILVIGFSTVVLIGAAATGYMMLSESQQKQIQCQQDLKNTSFKQAQISAQHAQQVAQLKAENKTLQDQSHQFTVKLKDIADQNQQQMDQLQKQNQALQAANQTLKENSDKKIALLARDLKNIQKEQQTLKKQYTHKAAIPVAKKHPVKKAMQAAPAQNSVSQVQPAPAQTMQPAPVSTPQQPTADDGLSLNFPAPSSGNGGN